MSEQGPRLVRTAKGYAVSKFNGRKLHFGRYDDPLSRVRFQAFKARWEANGRELSDDLLSERANGRAGSRALTVDGLADMYLAHLDEKHDEVWSRNRRLKIELGLRPLRELFGHEAASRFSPKRLQAVRHKMIDGGTLCRREINERVRIVRAVFTWAVAEEFVPGDLAHALAAVTALQQGEYGVREGRQVRPVERFVVDATLPYLPRPVAALVELMWWTGARPSELMGLRPCDLDRSDETWFLHLDQHKTARRGKRRVIFFGPEARAVLQRFLDRVPKPPPDKPLFSPQEAVAELLRQKRAHRKTPLYPSHLARYERERNRRPDRKLGETYDAASLRRAVQRAVRAANRDRRDRGLPQIPD